MSEFADIILPALDVAKASTIVEIGAEFGGMSAILAGFAGSRGGKLFSIDPAPKQAFLDWVAANAEVEHVAAQSLDAIPTLSGVDAWVIDGDHNWYTVYNELEAVEAACRRDGKPMLCFFHDVCWPCGRRDAYYVPDRIPEADRQPYDFDGGVFPGLSELVPGRGFRGMGQFAWATHEGGPRNGVKTAIEDFIIAAKARGRDLAYAEVPAVFGLALVFDMGAPWAEQVASVVLPFHQNRLIASLEANRLANYLTVLDLQDGHVPLS
jgi:hypothetical protein